MKDQGNNLQTNYIDPNKYRLFFLRMNKTNELNHFRTISLTFCLKLGLFTNRAYLSFDRTETSFIFFFSRRAELSY